MHQLDRATPRRRRSLLATVAVLLLSLTPLAATAAPANALPENSAAFQRTWARTDAPVADGSVARTWMWGPAPLGAPVQEAYAESPGGMRTVLYYDKSRMEVTNPDAVDDGVWFVTNGLLAKELITGEMQVGDDAWDYRLPAEINVAGDQGIENGPTYATLRERVQTDPINIPPPGAVGEVLTYGMDASGRVAMDERFAAYDVRIGVVSAESGAPAHAVAAPFWEFMTARGLVSIDGALVEDALFPNPYYATGLPITEPYWTEVLVGGTPHDVLFQCFERRCLTYTPANPTGWQVESGNIGQHYQQWRSTPPQQIAGEVLFTRVHWADDAVSSSLHLINADGADERTLRDDLPGQVLQPRWSPDGRSVAFLLQGDGPTRLLVHDVDAAAGDPLLDLTPEHAHVMSFAWAPDSERLALGAAVLTDPEGGIYAHTQIFTTSISTPQTVQQLTGLTPDDAALDNSQPAWSPDGAWIAYASRGTFTLGDLSNGIAVMRADGSDLRDLPLPDGYAHTNLQWTADSAQVLAERHPQAGRDAWGGAVIRTFEEGDEPGHQIVTVLVAGCLWEFCAGNDTWAPSDVAQDPTGTQVAMTAALAFVVDLRPVQGIGTRGLILLDAETGAATQLLAYGSTPSWSPDGQHLAFMHQRQVSHTTPEPRIGITSRDGSAQWLLANDAFDPQWRPNPIAAP